MPKVKKLLFIALSMFLSISCEQRRDVLILGTNVGYPPFEYKDASGEIVGIDIDISRKIAKSLGKKLVVKDMTFEDLIPAVMKGKVDMIVSAITMTEERGKKIDFSYPYFQSNQFVIVRKDAPFEISAQKDLKGKKIGVEKGTTSEDTALEYTDDKANVVSYEGEGSADALRDLRKGKLDVVMADEGFAVAAIQRYDDIREIDLGFDDEFYAVGIQKGNAQLLQGINAALREMKLSGELPQIFKKYKH